MLRLHPSQTVQAQIGLTAPFPGQTNSVWEPRPALSKHHRDKKKHIHRHLITKKVGYRTQQCQQSENPASGTVGNKLCWCNFGGHTGHHDCFLGGRDTNKWKTTEAIVLPKAPFWGRLGPVKSRSVMIVMLRNALFIKGNIHFIFRAIFTFMKIFFHKDLTAVHEI